jgi:fluoride exporter
MDALPQQTSGRAGSLYRVAAASRKLPLGAWVALGGGLGAVSRFGISGWVTSWAWAAFPWGTFVVNLAGSTLLGFALRTLPSEPQVGSLRAFLTIGFCGGFTTFSTFDFEMLALLADGRPATALAYALLSVGGCVAGVLLGLALGSAARRR